MHRFCRLVNLNFNFFSRISGQEFPAFNGKFSTSTTNMEYLIALRNTRYSIGFINYIIYFMVFTVCKRIMANSSRLHIEPRSAPKKIGHDIDIIRLVNTLITTKNIDLRIHRNCCEKWKFIKFLIFRNLSPVISSRLKNLRTYRSSTILSTTLKSRNDHSCILSMIIDSCHCAPIMTTWCHSNSSIETSII